jgi:thiol:disulfide interchange protein DsbD
MFRSAPFLRRLQQCLALLLLAAACLWAGAPAHADDDFLDPAQAFKFSARMEDPNTISVTYDIADGYYMYRERFKFAATGAKLGEPRIPPGTVKFDDTFQKQVETYHHGVTIRIPVQGNGMFTLRATGQGCADKGLCYPPQESSVRLVAGATPGMSVAGGSGALPFTRGDAVASAPIQSALAIGAGQPDQSRLAAVLRGGHLLVIIPVFVLLGLFLAFTPCMLPMVPILSSIIVGEGHVARSRGFILSLAYSLGMAIVYTILGVAAGLLGRGLAAALQNPWVLGAFAILIVAMALSMFGLYQFQMPAALQSRLAGVSGRQRTGKLAGVFAMGAISALIIGPCVAAPLAGALVYISQTRDVVIGGAALFALAIGMSIPLLLVGLSAGTLLPRAGAWMDSVKRFFGVLMLAMALWMVGPVIPAALAMLLWAALLLGYGIYLLRGKGHWAAMASGTVFALLGAMQLVGAASGARDPLAPLAQLSGAPPQATLPFKRVKSVAELDAALAATGGKTAMLDFYADWCVSCKEMEKLTFVDPAVRAKLANTVLLQADVTANDADDQRLLKRFGLFGPPGIILFDRQGKEIPDGRVVGYQDAPKFLASLDKLDE